MKYFFGLLLLALCLAFTRKSHASIYISVTGAQVKPAKIAVGKLHPLQGSAPADPKLLKDVQDQVRSDLELMGLFEFFPESGFVGLDKPEDLYQMNYEAWGAKNVAFVLKLGYRLEGAKLVLEAIFHDVPGQKKIFSTRYQYPAQQFYRLVHAMSEDVLKELTGEKGLFFSRIAMVCRDAGTKGGSTKEVFLMDADGRNPIALTSDRTLSLSPAWSPDGKYLLYTQYGTFPGSRKRGTFLKRHTLQNGERRVVSSKDGMNSGAAWNPKSGKVAVTLSFNDRPEIYLINPSGQGEPEPFSRDIRVKRIGGDGMQPHYPTLLFDVEPSWSPDGSKVVFSSRRSGNPMIYTADVATKTATQLTFAGKYNATPDWSPKGDKILFAAQRLAEGNFDLYMIDPDGNNLSRMTIGDRAGARRVNSENPTFAPTGRHFAYASNEGGSYAVYMMTTDGNVKRRISPPNRECTEPSWGPGEG